jgi:hypothetical protein
LGLGLLEETPASRIANDPGVAAWTATGFPFAVREDGTVIRYMMSGSMPAIPDNGQGTELDARGWGAARAAAETASTEPEDRTPINLGLVSFLALTVAAVATGYWFVAIAFAAGAAWTALFRRAGHPGEHVQDPPDDEHGADTH